MSKSSLLDHFSALEDPRQAWKVVYPLPEVLLIVLCGTMAGAEDFAQIERWASRKLDFLRRMLPFARGVPSHDTLGDVMNALPARLFAECFTAWVEALREAEPDVVAIDGKTSCRARRGEGPALHLVSAWASRQRLVLGQEAALGMAQRDRPRLARRVPEPARRQQARHPVDFAEGGQARRVRQRRLHRPTSGDDEVLGHGEPRVSLGPLPGDEGDASAWAQRCGEVGEGCGEVGEEQDCEAQSDQVEGGWREGMS